MNKEPTQPYRIKKIQQRNLTILGVIVLVAGFGLYSVLDSRNAKQETKNKVEKVDFATPLSHVDAQTIWIERAQNQLTQQVKAQTALRQQLQLLQQNKDEQTKASQELVQQIQALQTQVNTLQREIAQRKSSTQSGNVFPPAPGNENGTDAHSDGFINDLSLSLTPHQSNDLIPVKNPQSFIPAGTFVRAIALGGADAAAGVTSQGDPSPMLFRILDEGTLPNHRRSHLKNCVATAAAYGDISSKRGQIRLERLSCVKENNQVIEIPVEATIFGPDGKNGVRGNDYWGEGALLQRAFIAGAFSGISHGIAQSFTSSSLTPFGPIDTVKNGKILQYGVANGVGNAAEKLADYNIKRAEQFHPVIQLSAGTVVDIVFLKGFYLDNKKHSEDEQDLIAPSHVNDTKNLFTDNNANGQPAPLPLTPQQIQRLQQKNNELGFNNP